MTHKEAESALIAKYKEIQAKKGNSPDWAYKTFNGDAVIHPSIPFIGQNYFDQPVKMLVYASAEVLSNYDGHLDKYEFAKNRHRTYFDKNKTDTTAFPCVHIKPFDNGALTICAYHLLSQLSNVDAATPSSFLETIAFANYGKYTWYRNDGKKNNDYASIPDKLAESQPFVKADIETLKPDYILMIESMYSGTGKQGAFIDSVKGNATVIPIYQLTPTTINNPRTFRKFPATALEDLPPTLKHWISDNYHELIKNKNFMHVFEYLNSKKP